MQNHFFAYGTLLVPEVMAFVTGQHFLHEPATLHGFARYLIKGYVFPGIIASPHQSVSGHVYKYIDPISLERLDTFESDFYVRQEVTVQLENQQTLPAFTYIVGDRFKNLLTDQAWDVENFKRKHLATYLDNKKNF